MADTSIAAILRAGIFSPNHIANDAAILHAVVAELRKRGCLVKVYSEEEFCDAGIHEDVILAMCRSERALAKIQRLEDEGRLVVNSGYGIENCIRMIMVRLLMQAGLPVTESFVVDTDVDVRRRLKAAGFGACWVKKGEAPVHHLEDIARCRHVEEAQELLHEFFFRHIRKAVVSRVVEGEKIRCYGVASSGWFHAFLPFRSGGPEDMDEMSEALHSRVKDICMRAARVLNVDVFGCDIVLDGNGDCWLVNFDDWPSFAPIRKEAARAIAKAVLALARRSSTGAKGKSV
ncbi:MAG: hypothetical protein K2N48_05905 [Muribaculaceae bacterium]|nr:hypothetical protein [Muribaculaceae bacterium]